MKYSNKDASQNRPLVDIIGNCPSCKKAVTSNRLFTRDENNQVYHLSCFNELKKDDKDDE